MKRFSPIENLVLGFLEIQTKRKGWYTVSISSHDLYRRKRYVHAKSIHKERARQGREYEESPPH